jgi:DNA-binding response OmpR family regulator
MGMMTHSDTHHAVPTGRSLRKVMIVGNNPHQRVLETVANTGSYDVVIVESTARAYSAVKRVVPTLVVLCLGLDDPEACHVLSMLKLDSATSCIPVVTYAMAVDGVDEMTPAVGEEITLVLN